MSDKVFAAAMAVELANEGYGFDPATIITLITLLLPIIQNLPCFKKSQKVLRSNIDEEYRNVCKKRKGRCPPRARKVMKENGITDRDEQDDFWCCACKVAFTNRDAVAARLAA